MPHPANPPRRSLQLFAIALLPLLANLPAPAQAETALRCAADPEADHYADGMFLTSTSHPLAVTEDGKVTATGAGAEDTEWFQLVANADKTVSLCGAFGAYLTANPDGSVSATGKTIAPDTKFTMTSFEMLASFQATSGGFLTVNPTTSVVRADGESSKSNETFRAAVR